MNSDPNRSWKSILDEVSQYGEEDIAEFRNNFYSTMPDSPENLGALEEINNGEQDVDRDIAFGRLHSLLEDSTSGEKYAQSIRSYHRSIEVSSAVERAIETYFPEFMP